MTKKEFTLSTQQQDAANKVQEWYKTDDGDMLFRLFGYAGTGKTTITEKIIQQLKLRMGDNVFFGAYTGKAAMVMRKNHLPAATIHSLIYQVMGNDEEKITYLRKQLNQPYIDDHERGRIRQELLEEQRPRFQLRPRNECVLSQARLLVLDECSMINKEMLLDLFTFEVPMLVLGDPGQLPPIEGKSIITDVDPNVMLTEIHRQAAGNPIIQLATLARQKKHIQLGTYGSSKVIEKFDLSKEDMESFDQILVGKNDMRRKVNTRMRQIKGFTGIYPQVGEKLICLRNAPEYGLLNGMICYVEDVGETNDYAISLTVRRETDGPDDKPLETKALRAHFQLYKDQYAMDRVSMKQKFSVNEFDFAYAITVHKAQGSQWDNVCLIDDGMYAGYGKPGDRERWIYTALTRASERVTLAR